MEAWVPSAPALTAPPSNRPRFPASSRSFWNQGPALQTSHDFLSTVYFLSHQAVPHIAELQSHSSSMGHQKNENTGVTPLPTEVAAQNPRLSDSHSGGNYGLLLTGPIFQFSLYLNQGESCSVKNAFHFASELQWLGLSHKHLPHLISCLQNAANGPITATTVK